MTQTRLQYEISNWSQLGDCLSNNSKQLYISVSKFMQNTEVNGTLIQVCHSKYGTLFACMPSGTGELISATDEDGVELPWMTTSEILTQIEKFGFDVIYKQESHLPGTLITFLMKLQEMGYDKLNKVCVDKHVYVVAFKSDKISARWLSYAPKISNAMFTKATSTGYAMNLSPMSIDNQYNWDWLVYICNIKDVLAANKDVERKPVDSSKTTVELTEEDINPESFHAYSMEEVTEE